MSRDPLSNERGLLQVASVGVCAFVLKPDPMGMAFLQVSFVPGIILQAFVVLLAWGWHRTIGQNQERLYPAALFSGILTSLLVFILARILFHDQISDGLRWFGLVPLVLCSVPLLFLCFCRSPITNDKKGA